MPHIIIKKPTPNKQHVDAEKLFRVFVKSCPDSACSGIRNDCVNAVDSTVSSQSNGIGKQSRLEILVSIKILVA